MAVLRTHVHQSLGHRRRGLTAGPLDRPPGTWDVCFYEVDPSRRGARVTLLTTFTVLG